MLQGGTYWGLIQAGVCGESESGNPQIVITARMTHILGNDNNYQAIAPQDRKLYLATTDAAWPYTEKKLKALGFNGEFKAMDFDEKPKFEGVAFICKQDTFNGKPKEKWDLKDWGGEVEQASEDKLRRLNALWKSNAAPTQKPGGRPSTPSAAKSVPARQAPAPAAEAPAALADVKAENKEDAWAVFCEASHDRPDLANWNALVAGIGKPETQFTPADWQSVAESAVCPI